MVLKTICISSEFFGFHFISFFVAGVHAAQARQELTMYPRIANSHHYIDAIFSLLRSKEIHKMVKKMIPKTIRVGFF